MGDRVNWRRWIKFLYVNPNSPEGLIIRAEKIEGDAEKADNHEERRSYLLYGELLRQLAYQNRSIAYNRKWIKENLRKEVK